MVDAQDTRKVVLVVTADRGLGEAVDKIVARAKCRGVIAPDCATAERSLEGVRPVLVLVDPLRRDESCTRLESICVVVEIPVRTSASGVRRFAKPGTEAVRWLLDLVAERCASQQ